LSSTPVGEEQPCCFSCMLAHWCHQGLQPRPCVAVVGWHRGRDLAMVVDPFKWVQSNTDSGSPLVCLLWHSSSGGRVISLPASSGLGRCNLAIAPLAMIPAGYGPTPKFINLSAKCTQEGRMEWTTLCHVLLPANSIVIILSVDLYKPQALVVP
jgi:hypothetical protein